MPRKMSTLATLFLLAATMPTPAEVSTSRPTSRSSHEQMLMRMRYEGRYTEADLARPATEIVQEMLQTDDRRLLDMQVSLLRRKVLKNEQIDEVIKAAQDPSSAAKRVYFWQVLFDSGVPSAYTFLDKAFSQNSDEGTVLAFLQATMLSNISSVPLLAKLWMSNSSESIRAEIIQIALGTPRQPQPYYSDYERGGAARVNLLSWLLQHADTDEQKQKLLARSVPMTIADDARVALRSIKSAETRALIYKRLLRYPQDPWLSYLLTDEKDPQIQAAVIRHIRENMERGTEQGMWGELPECLRAAAGSADPVVNTEIQKLLEVARKKGIEQVFAQLKQSASYRLQHRDMGVPMSDPRSQRPVEAEVDDTIRRLQGQFGELPEEAELKQRLRTELESYRRQLEQAASRPG